MIPVRRGLREEKTRFQTQPKHINCQKDLSNEESVKIKEAS